MWERGLVLGHGGVKKFFPYSKELFICAYPKKSPLFYGTAEGIVFHFVFIHLIFTM